MDRKSPMIQEGDLPKKNPIVEPSQRPEKTPGLMEEWWAYIEDLERQLSGHQLLREGYIEELSRYSLETAQQALTIKDLEAEVERLKPLAARAPIFGTRDEDEGLDFS